MQVFIGSRVLDRFDQNRLSICFLLLVSSTDQRGRYFASHESKTTSLHLPVRVLQLGNHQPSPSLDVQTLHNSGGMKNSVRLLP